jgi:TctA family transporter
LTTIALISRGSVLKALVATGLGLMLALVGNDPRTGQDRYTFGFAYLSDGIGLLPVLLGLLSITEILDLSVSGRDTISGKQRVEELTGSVMDGMRSVFRHFGLFLSSSLIGTVVGAIPGVGGTVASFIAYGNAVRTGKDRERFGQGDIRGVSAPEAAHDAKDGSALAPTLAFGIPANEAMALLLAALVLHGLPPGRELMSRNLPLVFALIWSLFLSNWMTSIVGLATVGPLARLTVIRVQLLAPLIFALAALGAYMYRHRLEDVCLTFVCGIAGYYLKKHGWPRIPLVIALLLGKALETHLLITKQLYDLGRVDFLGRPVMFVLLLMLAINIVLPFLPGSPSREAETVG